MMSKLPLVFLLIALTPPHPQVMVFGDSLTAGYGLSPEEAFPAQLEAALRKSGKPCQIVNAGLSGETTAGGLSRIDWALRQKVDVFVLALGGNDGLRGLPLEQTQQNLEGIIDKVRKKYPGINIVLCGMLVPPNMGPEYAKGFKDMYRVLAQKKKVSFLPFLLEGVAGDPKLNQQDGIHPNPEGHKRVADNLVKVIAPLLK